jgi:hypothetical protein
MLTDWGRVPRVAARRCAMTTATLKPKQTTQATAAQRLACALGSWVLVAVAATNEAGCTSSVGGSLSSSTSSCPQLYAQCGLVCCPPGTTCGGGACVYPYSTAELYVYMCPSVSNCNAPKYFSVDNMCAPANSPAAGTCVGTGLQVAASRSYGFSNCQACGSSCANPVSFDTPRGFVSPRFAPGISLSCMGATCTPPPDCGGPSPSGGSFGGASGGGNNGGGGASGGAAGGGSNGGGGGAAACSSPRAHLAVNVSSRACSACGKIAIIAQSPQITAAIAAGTSPCAEGRLAGSNGCPMGQILVRSFGECGGATCGPYNVGLSTEFNHATPITDTVAFCPFDDSGGVLTPIGTCVSSLVDQCNSSATITVIIN